MFKLDDNLLIELGLGGLPPAEKNRMLAHIYETLEMRVGMRLAEQMTNEQLDDFERFIDANDEAGALKWLETNFPNYKDVVAQELDKLKAEIKTAAPQILAASQQMQSAMPVPPAPQGMQPQVAQPQVAPAPADNFAPQPQPIQPMGPAPSVVQPTQPVQPVAPPPVPTPQPPVEPPVPPQDYSQPPVL